MGIICNDDKKRKEIQRRMPEETIPNEEVTPEETIPNGEVTPEELQQIIDNLLFRKNKLENICGKLNFQNDDNIMPKSIEEYNLMIDKLTKQVEELEKIDKLWENKNPEIQFLVEGQKYITNVNRETKLGDAFKNALLNEKFEGERYTNNMDRETRFTDDDFKNTKLFNNKQIMFLVGGEFVTEYFTNNEPVPSLIKDPNCTIPIIVQIPSSMENILKTNYNK